MRGFVFGIGVLLVGSAALAAPKVPNADLAAVPEAWRAEWTDYEAKLSEERAQDGAAKASLQDAEKEHDRATKAWDSAQDLAKVARKAQKKARKSKDTEAARAAATARAEAEANLAETLRAELRGEAAVNLAQAKLDLELAETGLAESLLARAQAQAVADNGGWIEVARFDASVDEAKAKVEGATTELSHAESRAVLTQQGS